MEYLEEPAFNFLQTALKPTNTPLIATILIIQGVVMRRRGNLQWEVPLDEASRLLTGLVKRELFYHALRWVVLKGSHPDKQHFIDMRIDRRPLSRAKPSKEEKEILL